MKICRCLYTLGKGASSGSSYLEFENHSFKYLSSCHFCSIPQGGLVLLNVALACKRNRCLWMDILLLSWITDSLYYGWQKCIFLCLLWLGDTCSQFLWVEQRVKRERETHSWCCGMILNELLCFHTEVPGKWPQWPSVWYLAFAFSHSLIFISIASLSLACIMLSVDL